MWAIGDPLVDTDLEQELQRQLNYPWAHVRMNFPKGRRTDVAVRQPKICVVQKIEELSPELEFLRLCNSNVLECRKVPVHVSGALHHVAALVSEHLDLAQRIRRELLEGGLIEPLLWGSRTRVWISDHIGAVRGEAGDFRRASLQRIIRRVENCEGRTGLDSRNVVALTVT